jgi:hypothetical protein
MIDGYVLAIHQRLQPNPTFGFRDATAFACLPRWYAAPSDHTYGQVHLYGECRNTTDHHNDGKTNGTDITGQLPQH